MSEPTVIHIDTDKPCSQCKRVGCVAQNGLCLECINKRMADPKFRAAVRRRAMEATGEEIGEAAAAEPGAAAEENTDVESTNTTDHLKVQLTAEQKIELGEEITQHYAKLDELDSQLAGIKKQIGGEIETVKGALGKAIGTLRDGYRYDTVEILLEKDFRTGELRKTRLDLGEIYFTRALTGEERQRHLFKQGNGQTAEADADAEQDEEGDD